jgi:hypothetical protein
LSIGLEQDVDVVWADELAGNVAGGPAGVDVASLIVESISRQWSQPYDEPFSSLSDRFVAAQDDHIEGSEFQSHDRAVLFLPLVDSVPSVLAALHTGGKCGLLKPHLLHWELVKIPQDWQPWWPRRKIARAPASRNISEEERSNSQGKRCQRKLPGVGENGQHHGC